MKKFLLLSIFILSVYCSNAQFINGFSLAPSNPTTNDAVKIIAQMSFPSGGCSDHQQFSSLNGNTIYASALHCLGPLTVICSYSDTFAIGQLPAGNYSFVFNVNVGGGPSPCSPGIVPGPTDTLSFSVSQAAVINELSIENFTINYNPAEKKINVHLIKSIDGGQLHLYSITGQSLYQSQINSLNQSISVSALQAGLYILEITGNKGRYAKRMLIEE